MLKKLTFLAAALALVIVPAEAAKANKADKANKPKRILRQYDTNGNGSIDGTEKDALKKAFDADKTGPLKQFDLNADGKLDDSEIATIGAGKKGNKAAGKGKKKKGAAPATTTTTTKTDSASSSTSTEAK
jgi:hypothetical protein